MYVEDTEHLVKGQVGPGGALLMFFYLTLQLRLCLITIRPAHPTGTASLKEMVKYT